MKGYNGWENRETWALAIHLGSDEGLYNIMREIRATSKNWLEFSDKLKNLIYELRDEATSCPTKEILDFVLDIGSIERINFDEVAKSFFSDTES